MGEIGTWISHGNVANPGCGVAGSLMELGNMQDWILSGLEGGVDESDGSGEATDDYDDSDDGEEKIIYFYRVAKNWIAFFVSPPALIRIAELEGQRDGAVKNGRWAFQRPIIGVLTPRPPLSVNF